MGKLALIDLLVIGSFFILLLVAGIWMSRRAAKGIEEYFLGGRSIPWWALGASGTASNFDMTGTMVIISFIFLLGFDGFWVSLRGGMAIPLAFLMVFMGKWTRRSGVMTSAEWMRFRFGDDRGARWARMTNAAANIIFSVGMVVYFSVGTGKFLEVVTGIPREYASGLMISVALTYTVFSGLYGVIFTDLLQEAIMICTSIFFIVLAFNVSATLELPEVLQRVRVPITLEVPAHPEYHLFFLCMIFWFLKGAIEGMGGLGSYMSQRYFAVRNEREAGLMTAEWILLTAFRWGFIIALTVLGYKFIHEGGGIDDPEKVLPEVLSQTLSPGVLGLCIAGLMAAAMSTFDSTLNAGASYFVKDIYQAFIRPQASQKELMRMSYMASLGIAVIGLGLSFLVPNINSIWSWIVASLLAGLLIPLAMRWYWQRFSGYAYAVATVTGIITAIATKVLVEPLWAYEVNGETIHRLPPYVSFTLVSVVTFITGILVSLKTAPPEEKTLKEFYRKTRPFGLWRSIRSLLPADEQVRIKAEHRSDWISLIFAVPAQMSLFLGTMNFILRNWTIFYLSLAVFVVCVSVLFFTWYRKLPEAAEN